LGGFFDADARKAALARLEGVKVADGLRGGKCAEAIRLAGDGEVLFGEADDL